MEPKPVYGTIETFDLGTRLELGTAHPVRHLLSHYSYGWAVAESVCNGVASAARVYRSESEARARFAEICGSAS